MLNDHQFGAFRSKLNKRKRFYLMDAVAFQEADGNICCGLSVLRMLGVGAILPVLHLCTMSITRAGAVLTTPVVVVTTRGMVATRTDGAVVQPVELVASHGITKGTFQNIPSTGRSAGKVAGVTAVNVGAPSVHFLKYILAKKGERFLGRHDVELDNQASISTFKEKDLLLDMRDKNDPKQSLASTGELMSHMGAIRNSR